MTGDTFQLQVLEILFCQVFDLSVHLCKLESAYKGLSISGMLGKILLQCFEGIKCDVKRTDWFLGFEGHGSRLCHDLI